MNILPESGKLKDVFRQKATLLTSGKREKTKIRGGFMTSARLARTTPMEIPKASNDEP